MPLVVFSDKRPSLCFAFIIVQAVLRCTPVKRPQPERLTPFVWSPPRFPP